MNGYTRPDPTTDQLADVVVNAMVAHPNQRLGQIISNATRLFISSKVGLFNVSDEDLIVALADYAKVPTAAPCAPITAAAARRDKSVTETATRYTHAFSYDTANRMFQHRGVEAWLTDVLEQVYTWKIDGFFAEWDILPNDVPGFVTVRATEPILRFICVLFNQHAEQSPGDHTPSTEAQRLERTLTRKPTLTVTDLWSWFGNAHARDITTPVIVATPDGTYLNITDVTIPTGDEDSGPAIVIETADDFDPRQF